MISLVSTFHSIQVFKWYTKLKIKTTAPSKIAQKVWCNDLVYKKPFGYRVLHQNSLTPCSEQNFFIWNLKQSCLV